MKGAFALGWVPSARGYWRLTTVWRHKENQQLSCLGGGCRYEAEMFQKTETNFKQEINVKKYET